MNHQRPIKFNFDENHKLFTYYFQFISTPCCYYYDFIRRKVQL